MLDLIARHSGLALLAFLGLPLIIIGGISARHADRVCDGTRNRPMCELSLMAGDSDRVAHDAGNGIYAATAMTGRR